MQNVFPSQGLKVLFKQKIINQSEKSQKWSFDGKILSISEFQTIFIKSHFVVCQVQLRNSGQFDDAKKIPNFSWFQSALRLYHLEKNSY